MFTFIPNLPSGSLWHSNRIVANVHIGKQLEPTRHYSHCVTVTTLFLLSRKLRLSLEEFDPHFKTLLSSLFPSSPLLLPLSSSFPRPTSLS